jgi:asparagine synthase (glutamine-hydrolysing)
VARRHVTVALSGDAGDELFGGYNRYFWGPRIWRHLGWMPPGLRQSLAGALAGVAPARWDALGARLPGALGVVRLGEKAHKLAQRLRGARSLDGLYLGLVSQWLEPARLVPGVDEEEEATHLLGDALPAAGVQAPALRMMYRDSLGYLPDDILCKVDRAAMGASLETRVPFLDHRVAELAWALPLHLKLRGGQGKWALRRVLHRFVPAALVERPKAGFAIPVGPWLRGPLRDWAEALLQEARLRREGYLDPAPIRALWHEHLRGGRDATPALWSVLMFQSWLESLR